MKTNPVSLRFVKVNSRQVKFQNMHGTAKCFKVHVSRNTEHLLRMVSLEEKELKLFMLAKSILITVCLIEKAKFLFLKSLRS